LNNVCLKVLTPFFIAEKFSSSSKVYTSNEIVGLALAVARKCIKAAPIIA
jgi:hypothetical protein